MRLLFILKRFFLAWLAATISIALCLWTGRGQIDLDHPMTVFSLAWNPFGVVSMLCLAWLWFEAVRMVISPAGFRQTLHWPRVRLQRRWHKVRGFERV